MHQHLLPDKMSTKLSLNLACRLDDTILLSCVALFVLQMNTELPLDNN
eukprot:SAG31_NODE_44351_length_263_cov_0.628049_1_plen_47_part_01